MPKICRLGFRKPRRQIFGMVLSGEVESVGRGVKSLAPGDQVFGLSQWKAGCYAEYVCWPAAGMLTAKPINLTHEQAVALPYGGVLAMYLMRQAAIKAGDRILVYGASGAIGTAAVQLARLAGARVTGVCSARNAALVTSLGAERVLDYASEDFTSGSERYDVVMDAVGRRKSAAAMRDATRVLRPGGRVLSIDDRFPRLRREDLLQIRELAESGALVPVIDSTYPLDEIVAASRHVEEGHKRGAVVVRVATTAAPATSALP